MPIPSDAHYQAGSNRHRVVLANGNVVSRSAAENLYAQSKDFGSNYERRQAFRAMKSPNRYGKSTYNKDLERARELNVSRREHDEARARLYADRANAGSWQSVDKSPGGPLAQYLVTIGRRSATDSFNVGESPGIR